MSTPTPHPETEAAVGPVIPSLIFDNRAEVDALHFDALDQHDTAFHVIVAKTGYALGACNAEGEAQLTPLEEAAELKTEDRHYEDSLACSVRQESDLAPYKPLCDVIVHAEAHAPQGKPARRFDVRLLVQRPDRPAALPERPEPLNPLQGLSPEVFTAWQAELARARQTPIPGEILIDKTLTVTGERQLRQRPWPVRLLQYGVKLCTLGLAAPNPWRLTRPQPFVSMPLRYEFAPGGQCRIEAADQAAGRVPKKHRLNAAQLAGHPEKDAPPVAHDACETNPVGRGFALRWYLDAARPRHLPAPRIEHPAAPFSAGRFWQGACGAPWPEPAGLGFVGRAWLPRRALAGPIESKAHWAEDETPRLPEDFDFRYWNGAPADQQCPLLSGTGDERFTLINLCPPDSPPARTDAQGNTVLRFPLPRQSLFLLAAGREGPATVHPLSIDTVVIDLPAQRVDLTWRACLPADGATREARLLRVTDEAQLQRLQALSSPDPLPLKNFTRTTSHGT